MPTQTRDRDTRSRSDRTSRRDSSSRDRGDRSRPGGSSSRSGRARGSGSGGEARITAKNLQAEDRRYLDRHGSKLSPSTLRAKWIHSTDEHQDRPGQTLATRTPEVIRAWAEARDATPATVMRRDDDRPRTLRFDFPQGGRSGRLQPVDWDEWFRTFEDRDLVFLYQEQLRNGNDSNFFRLDNPKREEG
jgi:hypothetical protein